MAIEIERKFVLAQTPEWLGESESERIEQGYVVLAGETEVRVRRKGEARYLTVKVGEGESREETEVELSPEQFEALWPLTEGRRLVKRRHYVGLDSLTAEVDVYEGELAGLVVAEVEFDSEDADRAFEPPKWIGREVTGERRYSNAALAAEGMP